MDVVHTTAQKADFPILHFAGNNDINFEMEPNFIYFVEILALSSIYHVLKV